MPIVERFAPPAYLPDYDSIPGQLQQWHQAFTYWFDTLIEANAKQVRPGPFQFYNPARLDPGGPAVEAPIVWNAFPRQLVRLYGRARALEEADSPWTLARFYSELQDVPVDRRNHSALFRNKVRPQTEYCEWRVARDPDTNRIQSATFTCEPPEFWIGLYGGRLPSDPATAPYKFPGCTKVLLDGYKTLLGRPVHPRDLLAAQDIRDPGDGSLLAAKGGYNPFNPWNTSCGIVHLCSIPNYLIGAIEDASASSILRKNLKGELIVEPESLLCCAQLGEPNRRSDLTIGAAVNAAVRLGAYLTIKEPVGVYMDHIDLSGWEGPNGIPAENCVRIVRGTPGMIARLVVEVPRRGRFVDEIKIGGEPILYGGQIAECITVKLTALIHLPSQPIRNEPLPCSASCGSNPHEQNTLIAFFDPDSQLSRGLVEFFAFQGAQKLPGRRNPSVRRLEIRRLNRKKQRS